MITIHNIYEYDQEHKTAMTIGTFDGVHIGHKQLLKRLINSAKATGLKATVLTFFPHPRMVLQKESDIKLLNTIDERTSILEEIGLDCLIVHPFSEDFSRLSATSFVRDILVNSLKTKKIIIGYDHRFGRNRDANINDLITFGSTFDFEVEEISAQEIDDVSISSTKIRKALQEGNIEIANSYLGYDYMLTGIVQKGRGLGRTIQFPTANLYIKEIYKLIPKIGVYVVKSKLYGKTVYGMMNIGYNPTVSETNNQSSKDQKSIEIHFFNFEKDLYDQTIQIHLMARIRDEQKFDSIESLKQQLKKDQETALTIITG